MVMGSIAAAGSCSVPTSTPERSEVLTRLQEQQEGVWRQARGGLGGRMGQPLPMLRQFISPLIAEYIVSSTYPHHTSSIAGVFNPMALLWP